MSFRKDPNPDKEVKHSIFTDLYNGMAMMAKGALTAMSFFFIGLKMFLVWAIKIVFYVVFYVPILLYSLGVDREEKLEYFLFEDIDQHYLEKYPLLIGERDLRQLWTMLAGGLNFIFFFSFIFAIIFH